MRGKGGWGESGWEGWGTEAAHNTRVYRQDARSHMASLFIHIDAHVYVPDKFKVFGDQLENPMVRWRVHSLDSGLGPRSDPSPLYRNSRL